MVRYGFGGSLNCHPEKYHFWDQCFCGPQKLGTAVVATGVYIALLLSGQTLVWGSRELPRPLLSTTCGWTGPTTRQDSIPVPAVEGIDYQTGRQKCLWERRPCHCSWRLQPSDRTAEEPVPVIVAVLDIVFIVDLIALLQILHPLDTLCLYLLIDVGRLIIAWATIQEYWRYQHRPRVLA